MINLNKYLSNNSHIYVCQAKLSDYNVLYDLKVASMKNYIKQVYGWDELFQKCFFKNNFYIENVFKIFFNNCFAGAVEITKETDFFFLNRIEIFPDYQNLGIGTEIIKSIIAAAEENFLSVKLMVFKINPAKHLYSKLGFKVVSENDSHFTMVFKSNN